MPYTSKHRQTASNSGSCTNRHIAAIPRADADHQPVGKTRLRPKGDPVTDSPTAADDPAAADHASADHASAARRRPDLRVLPGGATHRQLPLNLEWEVHPGIPAVPSVPPRLRLVTDTTDPDLLPDELPDPAAWMARLSCGVAEVLAGERPAAQLTRWVSRTELARLSARAAAIARHPATRAQRAGSPRTTAVRMVRAVRICPVAPGVVEASAVLVGSARSQAVAMRLEATNGRWLATAVDLGPLTGSVSARPVARAVRQ